MIRRNISRVRTCVSQARDNERGSRLRRAESNIYGPGRKSRRQLAFTVTALPDARYAFAGVRAHQTLAVAEFYSQERTSGWREYRACCYSEILISIVPCQQKSCESRRCLDNAFIGKYISIDYRFDRQRLPADPTRTLMRIRSLPIVEKRRILPRRIMLLYLRDASSITLANACTLDLSSAG